ncbi:primosomal replication protein [Pseudidiomarina sp. 1ASP75-14]|uniref:primosomal replication protein PriC n=1 Tax=Pseudidiomarina terrestris TaxID=2820060 RepID=UPI00264B7D83|nr:primosomal replication protein PriC [Pseudidiomarina sp. 1ASP75-14]MDN7137528.1 primosomal replication protein [Pseudidiomarina sp. 1ASP75-14]
MLCILITIDKPQSGALTMPQELQNATLRLRQQLKVMRGQIDALSVSEEEFKDWFDQQLFKVTHSQPGDYITEIEGNIRQLERTSNVENQRWLAERIEQQMLALQRALRCFARKP